MPAAEAPINHHQLAPDLFQPLGNVSASFAGQGVDRKLLHLIDLRASQINQCAFCVKMHHREAHEAGETADRLERLIVWRHVADFSNAEKAALAWTEALTSLDNRQDYAPLRAELRQHYSDEQITVMTTAIAMINMWNRVQVSNH